MTEVRFHRALTVLLTAALLATLTVALTGGQRADAVDGPVEVVYVATGRNFPDALAGANLAATVGAPLLTVEPDLPIPATTLTALQSLDPDRIIVLGGPAAVSDAVVDALAAHARSGSVTRIEGTDRHDTAAAIADALPDKVHDADLLDGLDASAFARLSGGTFTGAVTVPELRYATPRTHVANVPSTAFMAVRNNLSHVHENDGIGADSGAHPLLAPVVLPHGASVTALELHFLDTSAGADILARLHVRDIRGGVSETISSGRSTGSGGAVSVPGSGPVTHAVDNAEEVLFMTLQPITSAPDPTPGGWDGNALLFTGASITYTLDEAP